METKDKLLGNGKINTFIKCTDVDMGERSPPPLLSPDGVKYERINE